MGRRLRNFVLLLIIPVVAAGAVAGTLYFRTQEPYRGYLEPEQFVDIPTGSSTRAIGERLVAGGVVRDQLTYRLGLALSGQARSLKAGEYRFDRPMSAIEVIGKIAKGDVYVVTATFPEGLTIAEVASIAEMHHLGSASAFRDAGSDPTPIHAVDPFARSLEGYLFP